MRKLFLGAAVVLFCGVAQADIKDSPIGAFAECGDGKYSTSSGSGTCSGHQGVAYQMDGKGNRIGAGTDQSGGGFSGAGGMSAPQNDFTSTQAGGFQDTSAEFSSGDEFSGDTGQLPNTGGSPLLMALIGATTALGAFGLRRRIK